MIGTINQILTPMVSAIGPNYYYWGAGYGFFSVVWLLFLILGLLLCVWIYRDANSRGMRGILWVIALVIGSLFFLGWLVVLVVYLLVRGEAHGHPLV